MLWSLPTILKPAAFILGLDSKPVDVLEKEKMKSTYVVPKGFLKITLKKSEFCKYVLKTFWLEKNESELWKSRKNER